MDDEQIKLLSIAGGGYCLYKKCIFDSQKQLNEGCINHRDYRSGWILFSGIAA